MNAKNKNFKESISKVKNYTLLNNKFTTFALRYYKKGKKKKNIKKYKNTMKLIKILCNFMEVKPDSNTMEEPFSFEKNSRGLCDICP